MPRSSVWLVVAIGACSPIAASGSEAPPGDPAGERRRAADWPGGPAALLEKLRLRDAGFDNRSIETEKRWVEKVYPRRQIAEDQFNARRLGGIAPNPPAGDTIPADFDQPHRVRQLLTVREPELTIEWLKELEPLKHPEFVAIQDPGHRWSSAGGTERSWSPRLNDLHILGPPAADGLLRWNAHMMKWCCGYGIARWIEAIDSVQAGADLLTAGGRMRLMDYDDSRFELQLDRDLILRKLVISVPGRVGGGSNEFLVETRGTVRPEGCFPVAESGRYRRFLRPAKDPGSVYQDFEIRFVAVSPRLSARQYDERTRIEPGPGAVITRPQRR